MAVTGNAGPAATHYFRLVTANITADDSNAVNAIVEAEQLNHMVSMAGWRGLEIVPYGTNAVNEQFDVIVQHIGIIGYYGKNGQFSLDEQDPTVEGGKDKQFLIRNMVTLDCILGATADGTAGGFVDENQFTCDTITEDTQTTFGTQLDAAFGQTSTRYSPTGDVVGASYWIPDAGSADYIRFCFDDITTDTAASANLLIKLFR